MTEAAAQPLSRVLGDFAAGLRLDDLPRSVVDQAKMLIVDAIGIAYASTTFSFATSAAAAMQSMGAKNVLIKGGHLAEANIDRNQATDYLYEGSARHLFSSDHIDTTATHGTGCTLAAAITANLALGKNLADAVAIAKQFVTEAIRTAPMLGHGHSPINIR